MKELLVLGAGTAGTMVVNKLRSRLAEDDWAITIVDQGPGHHYQPGYLFIPFGGYTPEQVVKPKVRFIPHGVEFVMGTIDRVDPEAQRVFLDDGTCLKAFRAAFHRLVQRRLPVPVGSRLRTTM